VAAAEGIAIGDDAIAVVARAATGSFRDALGTLEQLLAYSGVTIELDDVLAVLGAADADLLFGAVDAVAGGDARAALLAAARLAESGRDLGRFFSDLEAHARGLLVVQVLGEVPDELRVTAEQDERLAEQARRVGGAEVVRLLDLIAGALRALKDGADARTQLELVLVKAAAPELDASVKALQARLERLESGGAPPPRSHSPEQPHTAAGRTSAPTAGTTVAVSAATTIPAADPAAPEGSADEPTTVAAVAVVEPGGLTLEAFGEQWPAVLESLRAEKPMLAALLEGARPSALAGEGLTLAWPESSAFLKRKAEDPANRELIAQAIRAVTGASLRLAYELRADDGEAAAAPTLSEEELLARFVQEFDAELLPEEDQT
jgi:DNA polymerase-3 subunit gamma/tau